jgi:UDP-N-acetyl-D-mannosaminuronic acid dehydrogenase
MGLAFKPDIDDFRESPALAISKILQTQFDNLLVVEPNIQQHADFTLVNYNDAVEQADILVLLVKHREFIELELDGKQVLDFCGVLS